MHCITHRQGIGWLKAIPASQAKAGQVEIFNYGYTYKILKIEQKGTQLLFTHINEGTGKVYTRKRKPSTLLAIEGI